MRSLAIRRPSGLLNRFSQKLVSVVLRVGMVREIFDILALDDQVQIFEFVKSGL